MSQVEFRPVTDRAVIHIARHMREPDQIEIAASHGHGPHDGLSLAVAGARLLAAAWVDRVPVAVLGLTEVCPLTGLGSPWMLGTDGVFEHRRVWGHTVPPVLDQMLSICPRLINYVHEANTVSLHWLQRVGFDVASQPVLINGHRFRKFSMERRDV